MSDWIDKHMDILPPPLREAKIVDSWHRNAAPWTEAVRSKKIESRVLVTDKAIIKAIRERKPKHVIDIGCGEGWLANTLAGEGIAVLGVDAVPTLIAHAKQNGKARFQVMAYEALARGAVTGKFDVAVCNFSLLGEASVNSLFKVMPGLLSQGGALIVQTLHPMVSCGECPYADGWRKGSWEGLGTAFTDPAPWYFRTLESWTKLFAKSGFTLKAIKEPLNPKSGTVASVIFIGEVSGDKHP